MVLLLQLPHTESVSKGACPAPQRLARGERARVHATSVGNRWPALSEMYVGRSAKTAGEEEKRVQGEREREVVKYRNLNCLTLPGAAREGRIGMGAD